MPQTREEHIIYTRNEFNTISYYIKLIETLNEAKIKTYIDIGANIGEFCNILFEKISSLNNAYLIEPEYNNFKFMENHLNVINVEKFNCAIGYNLKNPQLINHSSNNVGGFILRENSADTPCNVVVNTLEELNLPITDFVKIDVEGGEFNIIENSTLLQKICYIDIEFHVTEEECKNNSMELYLQKYFINHEIIIKEYGNRYLLKLK